MPNHNLPPQLTIIIPLYNEQQRLKEGISIIKKYYQKYPGWEFILVSDGSTDQTNRIITNYSQKYPRIKKIIYRQNQGKGYAIRRGVKKAKKPYILFTDIDFSTPLSQLKLLYPFIEKSDLVIGTRKVKGAEIKKHQPKLRESLGKKFTTLTNYWLWLDISDFTCGFKLFRKKAAKKIFSQAKINRWGFDAEILFLAQRYNFKITEVPVTWENDERSKVNLFQDTHRSLLDLINIRLNQLLGKY